MEDKEIKEKEEKKDKVPNIRKRVFFIMQYEKHPETGEKLIDLEQIKTGLSHKSISKYAYILHDKDVAEKGGVKARHWHIVLYCNSAVALGTVAKWFGIPHQYIECPTGRDAFLDCVQYLTHESEKEQEKGKYRYPDEEVVANFDWRSEVDDYFKRQLKKSKNNSKERLFYEVLYNGKTLRSCFEDSKRNGDGLYAKHLEKLKKLRLAYLLNTDSKLLMPKTRQNYYVCGNGGAGKDVISKALARSLFSNYENPVPDNDIFFMVGSDGAGFLGYDGQPVIIYSDVRAIELIRLFGSRGALYANFDTHPQGGDVNIKYGSVKLINAVNIVNSPQNYNVFLDELAGEYRDKEGNFHTVEDKTQVYRRFQTLLPIDKSYCEVLLNKGWLDKGSYMEFENIGRFQFNAKEIGRRLNKYHSMYSEEYGAEEGLIKFKQKEFEISHKLTKKPREAYELVSSADRGDNIDLDDDFENLIGLDDKEIEEYINNNNDDDYDDYYNDYEYESFENQKNKVFEIMNKINNEIEEIKRFKENLVKLAVENKLEKTNYMKTDLFTGNLYDFYKKTGELRKRITELNNLIIDSENELDRINELMYKYFKDKKNNKV